MKIPTQEPKEKKNMEKLATGIKKEKSKNGKCLRMTSSTINHRDTIYHSSHPSLAKIKKADDTKCWRQYGAIGMRS